MANTRVVFSGAPAGSRVIPVAATATPGTLIHTAHATNLDAIYLWASNISNSNVLLTIEWGGVLSPTDHICRQVVVRHNSEPRPLITGQVLTGSLVLRVFANVANVCNVSGFATRIS